VSALLLCSPKRRYGQVLPALFRWTPGPYQRDYYTSANYESLQGVKDPKGPIGMTASPTARISVWPATPRVPDQFIVIIILSQGMSRKCESFSYAGCPACEMEWEARRFDLLPVIKAILHGSQSRNGCGSCIRLSTRSGLTFFVHGVYGFSFSFTFGSSNHN
jgi:hypothetical protein